MTTGESMRRKHCNGFRRLKGAHFIFSFVMSFIIFLIGQLDPRRSQCRRVQQGLMTLLTLLANASVFIHVSQMLLGIGTMLPNEFEGT